VGSFVEACSFSCVIENFERAFAGVYGPNDNVERNVFGMSWLAL
jgi:hypothetical protein